MEFLSAPALFQASQYQNPRKLTKIKRNCLPPSNQNVSVEVFSPHVFNALVFFLFGCSPFYTTWRSPLSAGGENTRLLLHLRHDTAGRWMRGGPGGYAPDMSSKGDPGGQETKWNPNAKKSEKLERGTCVREIMDATTPIAIMLRYTFSFCFLFLGRYLDMICHHHRHCRLGTSWCGGVQRNTFTVSQR